MAKPSGTKSSNKPVPPAADEAAVHAKEEPVAQQPADAAAFAKPAANPPTKDAGVANRPKKTKAPAVKQGSWMPNEQKLGNLAAAITAAGDAANLLLILEHVDAAGGPAEVVESIEAYRALKTAVEQHPATPKSSG